MRILKFTLILFTGTSGLVATLIIFIFALVLPGCRPDRNSLPSLVIKGSETELPLITNFGYEYEDLKGIHISISGGGSNSGIKALKNGRIDIANSSRIVTDEEKNELAEKKVKWVQAIIGVDAIAIISHPSINMESISFDQVKVIFEGKVSNWMQIGGPDKPIHVYGRDRNSGTHDFMLHRLKLEKYTPEIKEYETYGEILNKVKNDPYGIAYVSASCLKQNVSRPLQSVAVMRIFLDNSPDDYSPFDEDAINSGDYPFIRPLFQYYNAANVNPQIRSFIEFEISQKGQGLLKLYGYYKINVFHRQINKYNGF